MNSIRALFREVVGLFVDDGSLAIALLVWIGISSLLARSAVLDEQVLGVAWFIGCAVILIENVLRRARQV